jgi:hypothetical protein
VVAGGGHVETGRVQRVDGRLVTLDEGLEGRGADQVSTGGEDGGAGEASLELLDGAGELGGARLLGTAAGVGQQAAVEVVGAEDLDVGWSSVCRGRRAHHGEWAGDEADERAGESESATGT